MPFNIPGARVIEDIIAALPTNSRLSIQVRELGEQMDALKKENEHLKAELAALQPASGVEADTAKILKAFFEHGDSLTAEELAQQFQMKMGVVQYHFDKLAKRGFLRQVTVYGGYDILPAGRDFIVKNGMA